MSYLGIFLAKFCFINFSALPTAPIDLFAPGFCLSDFLYPKPVFPSLSSESMKIILFSTFIHTIFDIFHSHCFLTLTIYLFIIIMSCIIKLRGSKQSKLVVPLDALALMTRQAL